MPSKHIVFLIDSLSGGGAEKVVLRLSEGLAKLGHKISIVLLRQQITYQLPGGIDIHVLNTQKGNALCKLTYYWRAAKELQILIDSENQVNPIDLVISNLPEMDRVARFLKFNNIYFCIHNNLYQGYIAQKKGIKKIIKKIKLKRLYDGKKLIFVSEGVKLDMLNNLAVTPAQSRVIYNPFAIQQIRDLAAMPVQQNYEGYFIHIGRFNKQKRHDRLLRLFAKSAVSDKLLLLGEGSAQQKEAICQYIQQYSLSDKVIMLNFQNNPYPYIRKAKALLLTSDYEGFGNVLVEALLCGTPVISFDCRSGPSEILSAEFPESLVPMNDENKFISRLQNLSSQPERVNVSAAFLKRFDEKGISQAYLNLL